MRPSLSLPVVLLLTLGVLLSPKAISSQNTADRSGSSVDKFPGVIMECDGDQCTKGGGGALWIFEGRRGQAMWHYGAVADLTIERFDGRTVVIRRVDPAGTYSSRFAAKGQLFTAVYTGTVHGDRIDGTVSWGGTWYAKIPKSPCNPFAECPLDASQLKELGRNAANAKEYSAAVVSLLISAGQGNARAQGMLAILLHEGMGARRDFVRAFYWAQKSAAQGDIVGEMVLSQLYQKGEGTAPNAEKAKSLAVQVARQRAQGGQQNSQQQMDKVLNTPGASGLTGKEIIGLTVGIFGAMDEAEDNYKSSEQCRIDHPDADVTWSYNSYCGSKH